VTEPNTLLLRETGIVRLADGSEAVNVGPIVHALGYLTEGRGNDRGTDEHGTPLPDLLSLAFDVVQSIILGGRSAEYFRKVKQDFDAQSGLAGRSSLALAKQAATVRPSTPSTALERAAGELRARLKQLEQLPLADDARLDLQQALQSFQDFGADRWVAATSHLLLALHALGSDEARPAPRRRPARPRKSPKVEPKIRPREARAKPRAKPKAEPRAKPKAKARAKAKAKARPAIEPKQKRRR
jgi:hypothetical protein